MARLAAETRSYLSAKGSHLLGRVGDRVELVTDRLEQGDLLGPGLAEGAKKLAQGESPVKAVASSAFGGLKEKVTNAFGGRGRGGGGRGNKTKITNIVEDIDVGVPVRVAYNQWTQFGDFPTFMKKVSTVESESDEKLNWTAQVLWSHRTWESTILDQVPDERIVWRSKGSKGHVDGAVTFHEIGPSLTRILVVLEYHPQGFFERTGNVWRAQGRRIRLELKHFRRHVMTKTILDDESVEGWRGEIRDGEVVRTHEEALRDEDAGEGQDEDYEPEDEDFADDEDEDEYEEDEDDEDAETDRDAS